VVLGVLILYRFIKKLLPIHLQRQFNIPSGIFTNMASDYPKKETHPFKEYFLQFLMLFLAIVLGAIGENYREQYSSEVVERNMERETLQAMANDLGTDIINLEKSINNKEEKEALAKKLIEDISSNDISNRTKGIYYCARVMTTREAFSASEGAVTQLQNSGGYSMIKSKKIIEQINKYHYLKEKIYKLNDTEEHILIQYRIAASKIFNAAIFSSMLNAKEFKNYKYSIKPLENNVDLFSYNPALINEFVFWVSSANGNQSSNRAQMMLLREHAKELIASIEQHLNQPK
jgi:phosphopantetheinyl transferase (holo-ACP synthase)